MAYSHKITAKRDVVKSGNDRIPKGASVIISTNSNGKPNLTQINEAFENSLGVNLKGIGLSSSAFDHEKL